MDHHSNNSESYTSQLTGIVSAATNFCTLLTGAPKSEKDTFIREILDMLPALYLYFSRTPVTGADESFILTEYLEESDYLRIKEGIASLLGEDDTYLETVEEDMKYSETPIANDISEGLADIFQDLYNFITEVRESDGLQLEAAFDACKENFEIYWSGKLCSVMRPLNNLRYNL